MEKKQLTNESDRFTMEPIGVFFYFVDVSNILLFFNPLVNCNVCHHTQKKKGLFKRPSVAGHATRCILNLCLATRHFVFSEARQAAPPPP